MSCDETASASIQTMHESPCTLCTRLCVPIALDTNKSVESWDCLQCHVSCDRRRACNTTCPFWKSAENRDQTSNNPQSLHHPLRHLHLLLLPQREPLAVRP